MKTKRRKGSDGRRLAFSHRLLCLGTAVLSVAVAWGLTHLLLPWLYPTVTPFFFVAVIVSAGLGGWEAGLLATVLSTLAVHYFFVDPGDVLQIISAGTGVRLGLFAIAAGVTSWLDRSRRLALERARADYQALKETMEREESGRAQRRRAEEALRQSEDRFRAVAANLPRGAVFIVDRELRYLLAAGEALQAAGMTSEDLVGKTIWDALDPNLATNYEPYFRQALKGEPYSTEHESHDRYYISHGTPLYDERGEVYAVLAMSYDISDRKRVEDDRKQTEAAIQASNEQFKLLAESASNLLLVEDPKEYLARLFERVASHLQLEIYFNYFFQEGQQRLELHTYGGISADVAAAAQCLELGQGVCGYAIQQRKPIVVENALEASEPLALPLQSIGIRAYASHPLIVRDRVLGTLGLGTRQRDRFTPEELEFMQAIAAQVAAALERSRLVIQLQERAEALGQANRIKDEFLAVLSHELRSPLNPILGWAKLLKAGNLDAAKTAQAITTIERNAKLQSELIEDLLDVSRILQGKLNLNVRSIDLAFIVQGAIETVRLAAEAKSIAIETDLDAQVGQVTGDSTRLQQVVWNLLSNAVKFTPTGGRVKVRLEQVDHQAQITVSDNGKGIAANFLSSVFDYFRQENGATTRQFGGLGLGLAIVRHLVELHGGTVTAASAGEGLGATFTVKLPLLKSREDGERPGESYPLTPSSTHPLTGLKILVIDDESDSRDFVSFVLEQAGAIVTTASTASEGFVALTQSPPDVVVSDIGMPDMDGYMLMQQVRTLPPEKGGRVKAIALTAYAGDFNQQQALQAGFQQHLSKPVEPEALVKTIHALLTG